MMQTTFEIQRVLVKGSGGRSYQVESNGLHPLSCTCPHYEFRAGPDGDRCKHMDARAGRKSIGVTRCVVCSRMLTPSELESAGEPGSRQCGRHPEATDQGLVPSGV